MKQRRCIKKLIAAALSLTMIMSMQTVAFASDEMVELTEERCAVLESNEGLGYCLQSEDNTAVVTNTASAVDDDSPLKDYKEIDYTSKTLNKVFTSDGYSLKVNYTDLVTYSGKAHVASSTKGNNKKKQKDLYISTSGSIMSYATVQYSYKNNTNAGLSSDKKAPRVIIQLKAKKGAPKNVKKAIKALNKMLKKSENQLNFTIAPIDISGQTLDIKLTKNDTKVKSISAMVDNKKVKLSKKDYEMKAYKNDRYIRFKRNFYGFWSKNSWLDSSYKTVNFVTNCDETIEPQRVKYGTLITRPALTKDKYELENWYKNEAMTSAQVYNFSEGVKSNLNLYARWRKVEPDQMILTSSRDTVLNDNSDKSKVDLFLTTDVEVDGIDLYRNNELVQTLKDDGQYTNSGDELAGDGIYSARVSGKIENEGDATFKAVYHYNTDYPSGEVTVKYIDPFTQEELNQMNNVNNMIESFIDEDSFKTNTVEQNEEAAKTLIQNMEGVDTTFEPTREGDVLVFRYNSGVKGGVPLVDITNPDLGDASNGATIVSESSDEFQKEAVDDIDEEAVEALQQSDLVLPETKEHESTDITDVTTVEPEAITPSGDTTESDQDIFAVSDVNNQASGANTFYGKALILNSFPAFETDAYEIQYRTTFYQNLKNRWDGYGMTTTLKDSNVTVDDYKGLADYDVVDIATHGYVYDSDPVICLAEKATSGNNKKYQLELNSGEIVQVGNKYWILPQFFINEYAQNSLSKTFVFAECCMFMGHGQGSNSNAYDKDMATAFTGRGCPVVIGDHNSVFASYIRNFMAKYVDELVDAKKAGEAFAIAQNTYGSNHEIWYDNQSGQGSHSAWRIKEYGTYNANEDVAYPVLTGDPNAVLLSNKLENGNFENIYASSSINRPVAWSYEGDGRAVTKLGDAVSPNSNSRWMGLITSGIGSQEKTNIIGIDGNGTEGSRMYQTVKIPENASELSFDYNFVSEEPMEFVGSDYDDAFGVVISQGNSILYSKVLASVNTSTWYEIGGVDFEGGDNTAYETRWLKGKIDMTQFKGQTVTISFVVFDKGDKIYDSACLLDDVVLK